MIANKAQKPLWIYFAGGMEGEILCSAFERLGIHFSVLLIKNQTDANRRNVLYAQKWCYDHGIECRVVPVDIVSFFESDIERYIGDSLISLTLYRYWQIKVLEVIDELGGCAVMAEGKQIFQLKQAAPAHEEDVEINFDAGIAAPLEWCRRAGQFHIPYFFSSTPELVRSYLNIPVIESALLHPETLVSKHNKHAIMRIAIRTYFPELETPYMPNAFGLRGTMGAKKQAQLQERFAHISQRFRLSVPALKQQLSGH